MTDQMDDESDVCDIWMSQMDDELTDDGRMDDGGHHLRDTHRQTDTDRHTHEHFLVETSWFAAAVSQ